MTRLIVVVGLLVGCTGIPAADDVTFHDDVRLVEVYATVFDHGRTVGGLTREQFEVRDDGQPQPIRVFEADNKSLTCVLLLDTTGSMKDSIPDLRHAAREFIGSLRDGDAVGIYTFTDHVEEMQAPTTDKMLARRALIRLRAGGRTALFDSISELAREMAKKPGKKAIVVLTDGGDNASVLSSNAAAASARKRGIPVFAVAEGEALRDETASHLLHQLSEGTGGHLYRAKNAKDMEPMLEAIAKDLENGYLLAFAPPDERRVVAWHELQVVVKDQRKSVQVRARTGYSGE